MKTSVKSHWYWLLVGVFLILGVGNIEEEIWDFCAKDMGKGEWDSVHVSSFNRV